MPILTPFQDFLTATQAAAYSDYAARPGVEVASAEEFAEMRAYILQRYADVRVAGSLFVDNQPFDCIMLQEGHADQPSAKNEGCPDGAIPLRRITLDELTRFRTLRDFLSKAPGGKASLPD